MRQHALWGFEALIASVGYFLLLDFARPALQERHLVSAWWCTLGLYIVLVFGYGFRSAIRSRPKFSAIGFLLFAATFFSYDPTINPHLETIGMGWLWIATLVAGFLWLLLGIRVSRVPPHVRN